MTRSMTRLNLFKFAHTHRRNSDQRGCHDSPKLSQAGSASRLHHVTGLSRSCIVLSSRALSPAEWKQDIILFNRTMRKYVKHPSRCTNQTFHSVWQYVVCCSAMCPSLLETKTSPAGASIDLGKQKCPANTVWETGEPASLTAGVDCKRRIVA